jgi:murein DD-endopeptidase MepM/ murein hydrolase activator NlpD
MQMRVSRKRQNRIPFDRYLKKATLFARNAARSEAVKSLATIILVAALATASFYMGMWIERGRVSAPQAQVVERTAEPQPVTERSENTPKTQAATPKPSPAPPVPKDVAPGAPKAGATTKATSKTTATSGGAVPTASAAKPVMAVPVTGDKIFGYDWMYSPSFGDWRFHTGLDIKADVGAPVKAALGGTVLSIKQDPTNGLVVVLDHGSGLVTVYGGLDSLCVDEGDKVVKNQIIGRIGDPPLVEADLGPHLHFEVRKNGLPEDPVAYLPK